ncbi:hypothetical protein JX266_002236 [Neoarthrinium moseri]|nr:hypothetical protein JX266_002236 [Neoarthrinium moseri]
MQAWVLNNGPSAKAAPTTTAGHVHMADSSGSPQKSHVHHGQPAPAQPQLSSAIENSPPRSQQYQSRMPIVNHHNTSNAASRAAAASAARITAVGRTATGRPTQPSHSRDGSLNMPRTRTITSEPVQNVPRQAPFWEGSTVDGSAFSETASIADSRMAPPSRAPYVDPGFKARNTPRHYSKRDSDAERVPFVIGDNGIIDLLKAPLARSTSTSEARAWVGINQMHQDSDRYVEDAQYPAGLDTSPAQNTLSHRGARIPLRTTKRESFSERTLYPNGQDEASSPPDHAYQTPGNGLDYATRDSKGHLRVPTHEAHRSTMFENIDTPIASHQDLPESDEESLVEQPTPKASAKSSQPVNRQLFSKDNQASKGRNSLRESSMPRSAPEKRHSSVKKRHFELDYDDSALATMKYDDLKKQAFDFDPAQAESHSAQHPPQGTLPEKLEHCMSKDQQAQATFFTGMSVREWDDSGDWFLERFGDVMHRLKDARKAKRKLVDDFEAEIAEREEAVRVKIHGIGQTLNELRSEGEVMMKNKELE